MSVLNDAQRYCEALKIQSTMSIMIRLAPVPTIVTFLAITGCQPSHPEWIAIEQNGMVAADSHYASEIGMEVLRSGGNAVDAATAVSFALAVTRPYSTGLGGGGFALYYDANQQKAYAYDFRETAPAASTADMFELARAEGRYGSEPSQRGALAVAVPGLVAGRLAMQERFGTWSRAELIGPAIALARDGFDVDADYVKRCREVVKYYDRDPRMKLTHRYVWQRHLREGKIRKPGSPLVQPTLARLLELIARDGADAFYEGPVADAIVATMREHGGLITKEDLVGYQAIEREPIRSNYRGQELILMPPPSSGGVCLAQALNILENVDLPSIWRRDRVEARHYIIEALKHAFADRARHLGDTDFESAPIEQLLSKTYALSLAAELGPTATHESDGYGTVQFVEDAGTSHFSIMDRWGNVVASTETINTPFGSLLAVDEWGLILNNQMDDFGAYRDRPNAYGLQHDAGNAVAAGKRPLSSISPLIVLEDGQAVMALGASGGPRIISSVLQVFLGLTDFQLSLEEAMNLVRVHHQWKPNEVYFDKNPPEELAEGLRKRGHFLSSERKIGVVQVVRRKGSQLSGACDPRKGGRPAGY